MIKTDILSKTFSFVKSFFEDPVPQLEKHTIEYMYGGYLRPKVNYTFDGYLLGKVSFISQSGCFGKAKVFFNPQAKTFYAYCEYGDICLVRGFSNIEQMYDMFQFIGVGNDHDIPFFLNTFFYSHICQFVDVKKLGLNGFLFYDMSKVRCLKSLYEKMKRNYEKIIEGKNND